jgi:hypothetical protein
MSVSDTISDVILDKVSTATSRTGHVMERAAKLAAGGVPLDIIADLMTRNSPNKNVYTTQGVGEMVNAYQDGQSKPILTARQSAALLDYYADVRRAGDTGDAGLAPQPA